MLRMAMSIAPQQSGTRTTPRRTRSSPSCATEPDVRFVATRSRSASRAARPRTSEPDLVFEDLERLARARQAAGPAARLRGQGAPGRRRGKGAHPPRRSKLARALGDDVPVVYLPNYDIDLAKLLVSGVDVWLNTPLPPLEASGTSGMKAAHNGVPSLSVLDGWWLEGCVEGVTGWAIGAGPEASRRSRRRLALRSTRSSTRSSRRRSTKTARGSSTVMQHTIALNASFFNTHRMVQQYVTNAYMP